MHVGVVFPETEIGNDPIAIRDYAQAVEQMGYSHIAVYDHVLGAYPKRPDGKQYPYSYTHESPFHEPFVLYGYLAGLTQKIGLVTGVLVLPQRQTALVAKQAAALDILSGGRLRLGVGIGWNDVEYEALGENFRDRGRRIEEQIEVLRALWTQDVVTYEGEWHKITLAGINPLPVQRPIPVWMGGMAEPVIRRIARLADGWFPQIRSLEEVPAVLAKLKSYAGEAGRDPKAIGIEARGTVARGGPEDWATAMEAWREIGATHYAVNTVGAGLQSPGDHIEALRRFKDAVGLD